MPVKAGNCVKTGARVLVLDYGKVQTADIFLVGDCLVLNFAAPVQEGEWPQEGQEHDYQVVLGLYGYYHDTKTTVVVPKSHFQGEILYPGGKREQINFSKPGA